jgi:hypothetical protein
MTDTEIRTRDKAEIRGFVKFDLAPPLQVTGPRVADPGYWRPWLHNSTPFCVDGSGRVATDFRPEASDA